jgi:hypothetical protein
MSKVDAKWTDKQNSEVLTFNVIQQYFCIFLFIQAYVFEETDNTTLALASGHQLYRLRVIILRTLRLTLERAPTSSRHWLLTCQREGACDTKYNPDDISLVSSLQSLLSKSSSQENYQMNRRSLLTYIHVQKTS